MHPCPKCGNAVPDDQAFCRNCGAAQTTGDTPKSQAAGWELGATMVGKNFPVMPPRQTPAPPPQQPVTPPRQAASPPVASHVATPPPVASHVNAAVSPATPATYPATQQSAAKSRKGLYIIIGVLVAGFLLLLVILLIALIYIRSHS